MLALTRACALATTDTWTACVQLPARGRHALRRYTYLPSSQTASVNLSSGRAWASASDQGARMRRLRESVARGPWAAGIAAASHTGSAGEALFFFFFNDRPPPEISPLPLRAAFRI